MNQNLKGYWAVGQAVGVRDLCTREVVKVTGPDAISFLHAMLSNDVQNLDLLEGRYGALLTATGKILFDFWYYRFPDLVLIDLAEGQAGSFIEKLNEFIIMDEVELEDLSGEFGHFALEGPLAEQLLSKIIPGEQPQIVGAMVSLPWLGGEALIVRKNELAEVGFEILFPSVTSSEFRRVLNEVGKEFGLEEVAPEAAELLALERGIPRAGRDFTNRNNPIEACLSTSYSLTKGCYPGQEVLAKATNIGGVARLLTRFQIEGRRVPVTGASISNLEGNVVGEVTSAAYSPRVEQVIALGYVKRLLSKPGTRFQIDIDGESVSATAVEVFR